MTTVPTTPVKAQWPDGSSKEFSDYTVQECQNLLNDSWPKLAIRARGPGNGNVLVPIVPDRISRAMVLACCRAVRKPLRLGKPLWNEPDVRTNVLEDVLFWLETISLSGDYCPYLLGGMPANEVLEHVNALRVLRICPEVSLIDRSWLFLTPVTYIQTWLEARNHGDNYGASSLRRQFPTYCHTRSALETLFEVSTAMQTLGCRQPGAREMLAKAFVYNVRNWKLSIQDAVDLWVSRDTNLIWNSVSAPEALLKQAVTRVADRLWEAGLTQDETLADIEWVS